MSADGKSSADDAGAVHLRVEGPVATVIFDRPRARNALTWSMYEDLSRACDAIDASPEIRVAVLRGAGGKAFIAGTDIGQFRAFTSGADGIDYERRLAAYAGKVDALQVPTVAVVEGSAIGGGMAIATLCDFRLAASGARFGVPIARTLGNCLSAGNLKTLQDALGVAMVKRMLLLADLVPAEELLACGYVLQVLPAEELDEAVADLCTKLAGNAPITMATTRRFLAALRDGVDADEDARIEACYGSDDFREGVTAFMEKRAPRWRGR